MWFNVAAKHVLLACLFLVCLQDPQYWNFIHFSVSNAAILQFKCVLLHPLFAKGFWINFYHCTAAISHLLFLVSSLAILLLSCSSPPCPFPFLSSPSPPKKKQLLKAFVLIPWRAKSTWLSYRNLENLSAIFVSRLEYLFPWRWRIIIFTIGRSAFLLEWQSANAVPPLCVCSLISGIHKGFFSSTSTSPACLCCQTFSGSSVSLNSQRMWLLLPYFDAWSLDQ